MVWRVIGLFSLALIIMFFANSARSETVSCKPHERIVLSIGYKDKMEAMVLMLTPTAKNQKMLKDLAERHSSVGADVRFDITEVLPYGCEKI